MSSGVKLGKSARIFSAVSPSARLARTVRSVTRVPLNTGSPLQIWRSRTIRPSRRSGMMAFIIRRGSLLLFLHLSPCRLGLLNDFLLQLCRDNVVMMHFHVEAAAALGHRGEINSVGQHFRHWRFGPHDGVAAFVVHALHP